jgi:hypothetical protein
MIRLKPKANWKKINHPLGGDWWSWGDLSVHVTRDGPDRLWHLSISNPSRYPTWDEIYTARYDLIPGDVTCAIFLPRKSEYVNIHPNCFHVHQLADSEVAAGILGI